MLIVDVYATSHVGMVRPENEDNYLLLDLSNTGIWTGEDDDQSVVVESQRFEVNDNGVVFAVSDGMGGALAGEVASQMAVDTVSSVLLKEDPERTISPNKFSDSLIGKLYDATVYANHKIHQKGREPEFQGMGATFTGVAVTPEGVGLIQIGDSRTYLVRNKKIYQITKDQSLVQQLIDSGQISEEEAETHALRNVILQALGAQNEIYPVAASLSPKKEDILILCSDGLSNKIDAAVIRKIVLENLDDLETAAVEMVKEANEQGGEDNITLIIARLTGNSLEEAEEDGIKLEVIGPESIHDTADQDTAEIA